MAPSRLTCVGFSPNVNWRSVEFVCPLPVYRICNVCSVVPDTIFSLECGHVFCQSCISDLTRSETLCSCPFDNRSFDVPGISKDVSSQDFIMNSKVFCFNRGSGCSYSGTLSAMLEHFTDECELHIVHCRACKCAVRRRDVVAHIRGGCSREAVLSQGVAPSGGSEGDLGATNVSDAIISKINNFEKKFVKTCDELKRIFEQGDVKRPVQECHVESTRVATPDSEQSTEAVSDPEGPDVCGGPTEQSCVTPISQQSEDCRNGPSVEKVDEVAVKVLASPKRGAAAQEALEKSKPGTSKSSQTLQLKNATAERSRSPLVASSTDEASTTTNTMSPVKASKPTVTTPAKTTVLQSPSPSSQNAKSPRPQTTVQTADSSASPLVSVGSTPAVTALVPSVFVVDPYQESLHNGVSSKPANFTRFTWEVKPYWKLRNRPTSEEPCIFSSDPFFISENGYKARLEGRFYEDNSEVFLGLYFHLQKGPNDDKLAWPFKKKVSFVLLHTKHEKRNLEFAMSEDVREGRNSTNFCRPKRAENDAVGIKKCISASSMKQGGYIKNNTFKVGFLTYDP